MSRGLACAIGALCMGLAGCAKPAPTPTVDAGSAVSPSPSPPPPPNVSTTPPAASAAALDAAVTDAALGGDAPLSRFAAAKSIGNTSVVYKLTLASGEKAAFKPRSKRGRDRWKGEVAARRLALALGLDNVPPASFARVDVADLKRALAETPGGASGLALAEKEVEADGDGTVPGALIPWIDDFEVIRLESEPWKSRWRGWLVTGAEIPASDARMAAGIATMVVFDGVTGNWDRWSGANVAWDKKRSELLFIDNDGAFMTPTPRAFAVQADLVKTLQRFPRGLVKKLRALDEAALARMVGESTPGVPLLSPAALHDLDARRRTLLAAVDARIAIAGDAGTFAFE